MYRHGWRRKKYRYSRSSLNGAIWLIGLGFLFLTGHWWPGILILIGLNMVLEAVWKIPVPQTFAGEVEETPLPPASPAPDKPVVVTPVAAAPVNGGQRADLLPATCPNCGGPARATEVKWIGSQSATCGYCGSTLPMKKG